MKKAREFENLANKIYEIKDGAYWMKRSKELEDLLKEVSAFCPAGYKYEIDRVIGNSTVNVWRIMRFFDRDSNVL